MPSKTPHQPKCARPITAPKTKPITKHTNANTWNRLIICQAAQQSVPRWRPLADSLIGWRRAGAANRWSALLDACIILHCPDRNAKEAKNQLNDDEEKRRSDHHRNKNKGDWITASRNTLPTVKDHPRKQADAQEERDEKQKPACECEESQRVPRSWFLVHGNSVVQRRASSTPRHLCQA